MLLLDSMDALGNFLVGFLGLCGWVGGCGWVGIHLLPSTDNEKDGVELFTGTMMYFRVLLYLNPPSPKLVAVIEKSFFD
eukprot:COSAG05_NODE_5_length_47078_cov_547.868814_21_plen_79_part_00